MGVVPPCGARWDFGVVLWDTRTPNVGGTAAPLATAQGTDGAAATAAATFLTLDLDFDFDLDLGADTGTDSVRFSCVLPVPPAIKADGFFFLLVLWTC